MYQVSELKKLWGQEQLTIEQMIGQLLCYVEAHETQLVEMQRRLDNMALPAAPAAPPKRLTVRDR